MRISGVRVGRVKQKQAERADRPDRDGARDRGALRADPGRLARDAAPEDAARRDLRGAHAGHGGLRRRPAGGRRRAAGRPGVAHRGARRDPAHVRPGHAPALLGLARPAGPGRARAGRRDQRRAGGAHALRRGDRRRAARAARAGGSHAGADPRHRRGVRRADRAQGPAARPDRQLQPHLACGGEPRRGAGRDLPRAAHLPAREPHHHRAHHRVRARHRPAGHAAAPRRPPALADADRPRQAGPRPARLLQRSRPAGARVAQGHSGRRARAGQHASAAGPARPVPAPAHAGGGLPRALQARDRRLLRQRLGRDAGRGPGLRGAAAR